MNSSLSIKLNPVVFDSRLSIPIQTLDIIIPFIETNSQLFFSCYGVLSKGGEIIQSVYLNHLREKEKNFNQEHSFKISRKIKEFRLLKTEIKAERPIVYGCQKAQMIAETEKDLLHDELVSQFGKIYFGRLNLKISKNEFTKDRWLIVLFNQYFNDQEKVSQEEYRRQILEPSKDLILFRSMSVSSNPVSIFANRAVECLKAGKINIFLKYGIDCECGKLDTAQEKFLKFQPDEKNIVVVESCLDCYENLKIFRLGAIQKIHQFISGKKSQREIPVEDIILKEVDSYLQGVFLKCNNTINQLGKGKEALILLPKASPATLNSFKELCEKFFVEISLLSKKINDFIFLLNLKICDRTGVNTPRLFSRDDEDGKLLEHKKVFELALSILKTCCLTNK